MILVKLAWKLIRAAGFFSVIIMFLLVAAGVDWARVHPRLLVTYSLMTAGGLVLAGFALRAAGRSKLVTGMSVARRVGPALPPVRRWVPMEELNQPVIPEEEPPVMAAGPAPAGKPWRDVFGRLWASRGGG